MSTKSPTKAGMDAEAVARMMAAQNDEDQDQVGTVLEEIAQAAPAQPTPAEPRAKHDAHAFDPGKVDGRTLRKTGREPFATRIKPETHEALRRIAYTRRITIAEALESAVAAYDGS
ncbi:hypothetical protein [Methylobacterium sp. V23]|uniref:hypothetical protein n=1 Tax=Methylobacterium sp. V23 TaxID=2044878 RepID=UPI000CD9FACD|nr:hypothetical protein [Methylobacterium sp. V23]POR40904.1 hypothetical protein CRT23_21335 [Methylobacterium sp. V23]